MRLASEIKAVAVARSEQAQRLVAACNANPDCSREERVNREQDLREAKYQQAQAEALGAGMEERSSKLRTELEKLRGGGP